MSSTAQKAAPFPFLLVFLFFLLPFMEFSCKDRGGSAVSQLLSGGGASSNSPNIVIASLSGYEAAFGKELDGMKVLDQKVVSQKIDPTPMLIAVLGVSAVGALLAALRMNLLACFLAIAGIILLFTLRSDVDGRMQKENAGIVVVKYREGYFASLAALALAAIVTGAAGFSTKSN